MIIQEILKGKRDKTIFKNLFFSSFFKAGNLLLEFLIISIFIKNLGPEIFAIILLLFSILNILTLLDLGIPYSFQNLLTINKKKILKSSHLITNAYYSLICISILIIIIFFIINNFVNWNNILSADTLNYYELIFVPIIFFTSFSFTIFIKLISYIFFGLQKSYFKDLLDFISKLLIFVLAIFFSSIYKLEIIISSIIYCYVPILVMLIFTIWFFSKYDYKFLSIKKFKPLKYFKIFKSSLSFFILQLSAAVMFFCDNIIISKLINTTEITTYQVTGKYYSVVYIFFAFLLVPLWASYTNAYREKDYKWITKIVQFQEKIILFLIFITILMFYFSEFFFNIWLKSEIEVENILSYCWIFFVIARCYQSLFVVFLNGINILKINLILSIFTIFLNIPLSIYLIKYLNYNSAGAILASGIFLLLSGIILHYQYYKIINNSAKGVWLK